MFTGIVKGMAKVISIEKKSQFQTHGVVLPDALLPNLEIGASIAHNGCCLTVTKIEGNTAFFDLMQATLALTNLGKLTLGDDVNVERAARFGDDIGGHSMSGHITTTVPIDQIIDTENNRTIWFNAPSILMKYLLAKGYVGLDGCSLTIGEVENDRFSVHLIPETMQRTLFGHRTVGDLINLEIDPQTQAIVDTIERVLAQRA
jgi:riboflavin synthase